jgi:mannose-6-phosphate isomerase-like protein (cupin superfamily)
MAMSGTAAPLPRSSQNLACSIIVDQPGARFMKGYVEDLETAAIENTNFRQVLYTAQHSQLVVMSLKPGEDIGLETHQLDQYIQIVEGSGEAVLDGVHSPIRPGFAVLVPAGTRHNIVNTGDIALKLTTLYAPPNHRDGVVHATRADADNDEEAFDGKTTERRIPVTATDRREEIPVSRRPQLALHVSLASSVRI